MQNTRKSSPTSFLQEASNDMHENDGAALNVNILVKIRSTPYQVSQRGTVWLLLGCRRGCGGRDVWCGSGDWCAAVSTASSDRSTAFDPQDPCFGGRIAFCLGSIRSQSMRFGGSQPGMTCRLLFGGTRSWVPPNVQNAGDLNSFHWRENISQGAVWLCRVKQVRLTTNGITRNITAPCRVSLCAVIRTIVLWPLVIAAVLSSHAHQSNYPQKSPEMLCGNNLTLNLCAPPHKLSSKSHKPHR